MPGFGLRVDPGHVFDDLATGRRGVHPVACTLVGAGVSARRDGEGVERHGLGTEVEIALIREDVDGWLARSERRAGCLLPDGDAHGRLLPFAFALGCSAGSG